MSRYLRRAAVAAAAAVALSAAAMGAASDRSLSSSFGLLSSSPGHAAAPGHLSLVRSHPDLRGLDALLTPKAFLLEATRALASAALRDQPLSGEDIRVFCHGDFASKLVAKAEAERGDDGALRRRIELALLDAEDGRFDDALDALALIAAERPSDPRPRLSAAGICYLAGMMQEGNQWVSGIPEVIRHHRDNKRYLRDGVLAAALGGAPGAIAGFEGLVGFSAFEVIETALWANFLDGNISFLKMILLRALLWRALVAGKYKDYCQGKVTVTGAQQKNDLGLDDTISR